MVANLFNQNEQKTKYCVGFFRYYRHRQK